MSTNERLLGGYTDLITTSLKIVRTSSGPSGEIGMLGCGAVRCSAACGVWCVVCGVWCVVCGAGLHVWAQGGGVRDQGRGQGKSLGSCSTGVAAACVGLGCGFVGVSFRFWWSSLALGWLRWPSKEWHFSGNWRGWIFFHTAYEFFDHTDFVGANLGFDRAAWHGVGGGGR